MFKILGLLISFLLGQFKSQLVQPLSFQEMVQITTGQARMILGAAALGLAGMTLLLVGFLVSYFTLLHQIDVAGTVTFGAVVWGGIALIAVGAGLLFIAKNWKPSLARQTPYHETTTQQPVSPSPLEQALSALVVDYIKEREFNRDARKAQP